MECTVNVSLFYIKSIEKERTPFFMEIKWLLTIVIKISQYLKISVCTNYGNVLR